ncbi:2,3-bisphosphoglycerate-dependent phosphoglycerate mutase [Candidatus Peregrinibacteria bacterium]|nr:2,3-bisphosphoglycerate-dependent phosphoglycerate mutase [Candidatus Peregrinibacteria bacterium]
MGILVALRHGQSQWNLENRFTGWTDMPLTERGREDAAKCAAVLKKFTFDVAYTSRLSRASETLSVILKTLGQNPPVEVDSALNERHYGDLQGLNKAETVAKHGEKQVQLWRRSYTTRPPNGESIEDCERRTWPFFVQYVLPHLVAGKTVIIAAHGNSLRPIIKNLEGLTPDATAVLEIGLCTPYVYRFEGTKMASHEVLEVPGIVTKGASLKEAQVSEGRV